MDQNMIKIAVEVLSMNDEEVTKHCKVVQEADAMYFWQPKRGGISVIINSTGEKLAATSAVSFQDHVKAFLTGKRN